jgi:hypothetical protein
MTAHEMRAYRGPTRKTKTRGPRAQAANDTDDPGCIGSCLRALGLAVFLGLILGSAAALSVAAAVSQVAGWWS